VILPVLCFYLHVSASETYVFCLLCHKKMFRISLLPGGMLFPPPDKKGKGKFAAKAEKTKLKTQYKY